VRAGGRRTEKKASSQRTRIRGGNEIHRKSSAAWEADQIRVLDPAFSAQRWLESYPMTDDAQKAKLLRALGQLGL
jgi:hypothetical protein